MDRQDPPKTKKSYVKNQPKLLNGKTVSHADWIAHVIEIVRELGVVKPREVSRLLGPEYDRDSKLKTMVAGQMGNLHEQGKLVKDERGYYRLSPTYDLRRSRTVEGSLIETLRDLGGMAHAHEILDAYGLRPATKRIEGDEDGGRAAGGRSTLYKALKRSPHFHRIETYRKKGTLDIMWSLSWAELSQQPLTSRNFDFLTREGYLQEASRLKVVRTREEEAAMFQRIQTHFEVIGGIFNSVLLERGEDEIYAAADDPAIADVLTDLRKHNTTIANKAFADVRREAELLAQKENREKDEAYVERLREKEAPRINAHVLAMFLQGNPVIHEVMPASFYRAFAARYGLCPVALSRGTPVPLMEVFTQPKVVEDEDDEEDLA